MEDGAESTQGVQGDEQVGSRGFGNSEKNLESGLGVCFRKYLKVGSSWLLNSEQSRKRIPSPSFEMHCSVVIAGPLTVRPC